MTFSLSGTIITQTGTDTNLSGLSAIAGVTTTTVRSRVYYDLGTLQLVIEGTLSHNPDLECIITKVAGALESIKVEGTYNFGVETTVSGKSRMSSGVGIVAQAGDTGSTPEFNVAYSALKIDTPAGVFVGRGGVILSDRVICTNGTGTTIDVVGTVFTKIGTTARRELRFENVVATDTISGKFLGVVDGFQVSHRLLPPIFSPILANGEIVQLSNGPNLTELSDIDISNNIASNTDLGIDDLGTGAKFYDLVGCSDGSAIRCMPKSGVGDARQLGGLLLKKTVSFNFTDDSASPIQNVKLYCIDTDNGYRKNANGQNHTADKVYQYTSDVSGDISAFDIITAITNIDSESSGWAYSNWDTTAFTNRYKVDRRGLDDTTDDRFTFYFMSYSHRLSQVTLSCKGLGELKTDWVLLGDSLITETNKTTVDAYLLVNTSQQVYDRFKSYLYDNFAGEAETLLSRAGNVLTLGANNLVIDATAAAVVAYSEGTPDTFTIKSSTFTGGVTTTGTVTLQNGALLSGGTFDCDIITADNGVTYTNITATKITHTTASTATITLDGSTVTEIEVTGGGALTVNLVNGATVTTQTETSGTITILRPATLTLTGLQTGSDIVILEPNTSTEYVNVDANAGTTYAFEYDAEIVTAVDIGVFKTGYVPFFIRNLSVGATDASIPISQVADRVYIS